MPLQIKDYYDGIPEPVTGSILTISSTIIPPGYLALDGTEISRNIYVALFSAIGSYYGEGDGSNTFNLPNLSNEDSISIVSYIIKT